MRSRAARSGGPARPRSRWGAPRNAGRSESRVRSCRGDRSPRFSSIGPQVDPGVPGGDTLERFLRPIGVARPWEAEEVALPHAALRQKPGPALGRLLGPGHLAAPGRAPDLKVDEDGEARPAG